MTQSVNDTIVAISSAIGPAARMIVRMTGPQSHAISHSLTAAPTLAPAVGLRLRLGVRHLPAFPTWLYAFAAPNSVTGEDLIEFHLPGNPLLARMLLDDCVSRGARLAEPGEFTA